MKYLFIDSATTNLVVAIIIDNKLTYSFNNNIGHDTSSQMMPVLEQAFEKSNITPKDLNKIFIVTGPGSFTGIRVGLTVAKTMAYCLNIPLIPVSSLAVLASKKAGTALINARRGYVFAGSYDENLNNTFKDSYIPMDNNLKKPYISYDEFEFTVEKPEIDILKVIKKYENCSEVNPHALNPNYLKLTEAEEKLKIND